MSETANEIIVKNILASSKNLLILDTCCILDIVRSIPRSNHAILESAMSIISEYRSETYHYIMVLPSLVSLEWNENSGSVMTETKMHIEKQDEFHRTLVKHYNTIFSASLTSAVFSQYEIEKKLLFLSQEILGYCLKLDTIPECKHKAIERVISCVPPSAKGKDSTKDCIIFEEVMWLCDRLRYKGYPNKIVFSSSNTKEYDKQEIIDELQMHAVHYANSLNHAYHLASSS